MPGTLASVLSRVPRVTRHPAAPVFHRPFSLTRYCYLCFMCSFPTSCGLCFVTWWHGAAIILKTVTLCLSGHESRRVRDIPLTRKRHKLWYNATVHKPDNWLTTELISWIATSSSHEESAASSRVRGSAEYVFPVLTCKIRFRKFVSYEKCKKRAKICCNKRRKMLYTKWNCKSWVRQRQGKIELDLIFSGTGSITRTSDREPTG